MSFYERVTRSFVFTRVKYIRHITAETKEYLYVDNTIPYFREFVKGICKIRENFRSKKEEIYKSFPKRWGAVSNANLRQLLA